MPVRPRPRYFDVVQALRPKSWNDRPSPASRSRRRRTLAASLRPHAAAGPLALLALVVAGCNPHLLLQRSISGSLILDQQDPVERGGGECRGTGGYADLRSGVEVVVRDANGEELGRTTLRAQPAPTLADGTVPDAERRRCVWSFGLGNLPDRPVYEVSIGERGSTTYTREELEANGWQVQVSLGT